MGEAVKEMISGLGARADWVAAIVEARVGAGILAPVRGVAVIDGAGVSDTLGVLLGKNNGTLGLDVGGTIVPQPAKAIHNRLIAHAHNGPFRTLLIPTVFVPFNRRCLVT